MDKLNNLLRAYAFGFFSLAGRYSRWAESQACNERDLFLLAAGPWLLTALWLVKLPVWAVLPVSILVALPPAYMAALAIRTGYGRWRS